MYLAVASSFMVTPGQSSRIQVQTARLRTTLEAVRSPVRGILLATVDQTPSLESLRKSCHTQRGHQRQSPTKLTKLCRVLVQHE